MPRRNLIVINLTLIVCLVCYHRADRTPYAQVFGRAMDLISHKYVEPVEERELFEGAMEGMVNRLDQHSAYIGPEALMQFKADLDQEFGGVGIEVTVDHETDRLMVMSPLLDTPAYDAGMRAGDLILKIDDQDTEGMTLRESVKIMRGKPGTVVRLTVLHQGEEETVDFEITRAVIQTDSVLGDLRDAAGQWQYHLEENPRIGYIRLTTFGEHTVTELRDALRFQSHPVDALILDLRNNAGGLLTAAIAVCDMFIGDGKIVSSRGRDGKPETIAWAEADTTIFPAHIPIAILVNDYSASAAEIVAACLKDHGRAKIVGTRTWGKGTVQNVIPLEPRKGVLKLTTASYWRPNNQNIHRHKDATDEDEWGVKPHAGFEVRMEKEQAKKVFLQRRERDIIRTDENGEVQPPQEPPASKIPSDSDGDGDDGSTPDPDAEKETPDDDARDSADDAESHAGEVGDESAEALKLDDGSLDDGSIDDPQLRRAIEYLETQLSKTHAAAELGTANLTERLRCSVQLSTSFNGKPQATALLGTQSPAACR